MPPNQIGGKGYRKGKHSSQAEAKMLEWDASDGQMLGRAVKKLGDRRFRVFCNDNVERICKLAGSMKKSQWVDEGAIVLMSTRELGNASMGKQLKDQELGDILSVVDTRIYGKLKKQEGVNPLLFTHVENEDEAALKKKINAMEKGEDIEEDIFERGDEEEQEDADDATLTAEQKEAKKRAREEKRKERDQNIASRRDAKHMDDDGPIDIDAI